MQNNMEISIKLYTKTKKNYSKKGYWKIEEMSSHYKIKLCDGTNKYFYNEK